jgi:tRNA threonylcarbamoyladenosine biosynthesis protein TsaB
MMFLAIRTDKPEAELYLYEGQEQLQALKWQAHRELSLTIHKKMDEVINAGGKTRNDIEGLVIYKGPGSFTGLRIGFSAANAMAYARHIPVVAAGGEDWLEEGWRKLEAGQNDKVALPEYGAPPHVTQPKK